MKILITGDKGFVGTETRKLLESLESDVAGKLFGLGTAVPFKTKDHEVIGYDLMDGYDIRDYDQFRAFCINKRPDRVLHLGAIARFADADKNPKLCYETNVEGTKNVVDVCKELHIPLVYSSTGSVYMPIKEEPPITEEFQACGNSVYGCSKYLGETYVKEHNPFIILRYAHLYGKEKRMHGLIGGYYDRIKRGMAPTLYGGKQSNDFTYIKDVAKANLLALTAPWDKWNQVYNVGTGEELTAEDAGKIICELTGWKGGVEKKTQREVDPGRFVYDMTKSETMLGFKADYDFESGLRDMFDESTNS
jgi:UDP-glucose 4-epimerase